MTASPNADEVDAMTGL